MLEHSRCWGKIPRACTSPASQSASTLSSNGSSGEGVSGGGPLSQASWCPQCMGSLLRVDVCGARCQDGRSCPTCCQLWEPSGKMFCSCHSAWLSLCLCGFLRVPGGGEILLPGFTSASWMSLTLAQGAGTAEGANREWRSTRVDGTLAGCWLSWHPLTVGLRELGKGGPRTTPSMPMAILQVT